MKRAPDGKQVAFVSFADQFPQLFVIDAKGGEPRKLTDIQGLFISSTGSPELKSCRDTRLKRTVSIVEDERTA